MPRTNIEQIVRAELTRAQAPAALDTAKEVLCIACAGSGKSRTLAYRLAHLLANGEPADGIVAFTFTDKAAESIKRRVAQALEKVGLSANLIGQMFIGTIHSYCQNVLGQADAQYRQYDVLDDNKLVLYMMSRYGELGLGGLRAQRNAKYFQTIREVADAFKLLNDEGLRPEDVVPDDHGLATTLIRLRELMDRDQFIDFSTMIRRVVDRLAVRDTGAVRAIASLRHLLVDEYQDVSPTQDQLIRLLHDNSDTLFVVGDDDQAIYGWRGADVSNILAFEDRFPNCHTHVLSTNFRSTDAIVNVSSTLAASQLGAVRLDKNPNAHRNVTPRHLGVNWLPDRTEEARWVAARIEALLGTEVIEEDGTRRGLTPADFAVLMRSTRTTEQDGTPRHSAFTSELLNRRIPYSLEAGGGPFDRPEVQALRDAFLLLRNRAPTRNEVRQFFTRTVLPLYPRASLDGLARVFTHWGREIHTPPGGARRRVFPQNLVFEFLQAFGVDRLAPEPVVMRDIGLFSRMMQDVESVYLSIDSQQRFGEILNFLENVAERGYDVSTDDVVLRPDAVTVATVHKVKGLEYPCVFVVDVEQGRFPGKRHKYDGWLPANLIAGALQRGAYVGSDEEEARLFYTAITRAERYLYVSGAERLPGGRQRRKRSVFARALNHNEVTNDLATLPVGLGRAEPRRRLDEGILPTSFSDVRYYLRCPMDYRFRKGFGFSPSVPEMFGFGRAVHVAIEKLHELFRDRAPTREEAADAAEQTFHLKHIAPSNDPVERPGPFERAKAKARSTAADYANSYASDFQKRRQVEARFEIPANGCLIAGAIDLLFKEDEAGNVLEAEVVDFKAIEGGPEPEQNEKLEWTELALQVQLYAKAAREVLGENAAAGSIHLLKDNQRISVPVDEDAVSAAVQNVEWAVRGVLGQEFPMRPHALKCGSCDFRRICTKSRGDFSAGLGIPPPIATPSGATPALSFSLFDGTR